MSVKVSKVRGINHTKTTTTSNRFSPLPIVLGKLSTEQYREFNTLSSDGSKHNTNNKILITKIMMTNSDCNKPSYRLIIFVPCLFSFASFASTYLITALVTSPRTRSHTTYIQKFSNFGPIFKLRNKISPFSSRLAHLRYDAASLLVKTACQSMTMHLEIIGRMAGFSLKLCSYCSKKYICIVTTSNFDFSVTIVHYPLLQLSHQQPMKILQVGSKYYSQ